MRLKNYRKYVILFRRNSMPESVFKIKIKLINGYFVFQYDVDLYLGCPIIVMAEMAFIICDIH